jgi:LysM repeat protein
MSPRTRLHIVRAAVAALALAAAACGPASLSNSTAYKPPPPLAMVVIVDPSPDRMANELHQLEGVIRSNATPGEAVVVMLEEPSFGQTYSVRQGDSLASIAAAHGLTLAALEAANPQLGPVSGRNWKLIYSGEKVILPDGATQDSVLLVSRAPAGPPPPGLVRLPHLANNPTDYQRAEYQRTVAADNATNDARVAQWRLQAQAALGPWQDQVIAQLDKAAGSPPAAPPAPSPAMLSASVGAGLTTLHGLNGRRLLVVLGGAESGPAGLAPHSLAQIDLVIANLADSAAAAAWSAAAQSAGAASVSALDPALTQLQLAQVINQSNQGGT